MNPFGSVSDDFYVNVYINTQLELPRSRETLLEFFERVQKVYPEMREMYRRDNDDYVLEENKERGSYRWVTIESRRLCSGWLNPPDLARCYEFHETVLDLAPFYLGLRRIDCEAVDVLFGFDFLYNGNHDDVVAEAIGVGRAMEGLLDIGASRVIEYEPSLTLALDDGCRLQCRLNFETRTNAFQVRTGDYSEDQISVYFTIRQYGGEALAKSFVEAMRQQRQVGEELVQSHVVPHILRPLAQAIAAR